jgi:hypothetical protein
MFPQTFGTMYFSKRFPISTEQQVLVQVRGLSFIDYPRVVIVELTAGAIGASMILKNVGKNVWAEVSGVMKVLKGMTYSIVSVCRTAAIVRKVTLPRTIVVFCTMNVRIVKQAMKFFRAAAQTIVLIRRFRLYEFQFEGEFVAGDVVTIDSKTFEVTLNGENALHLTGKDNFPTVRPGEQVLTYADEEGSRTVRVKIRWKDRWL